MSTDKQNKYLEIKNSVTPNRKYTVYQSYFDHYPNKIFKVPELSLLYRGPWLINKNIIHQLAYYSIFFDKIYIPAYTILHKNDEDYDHIVYCIKLMCKYGLLEPFSIYYHSYMLAMGRDIFFNFPVIPLYQTIPREVPPADVISILKDIHRKPYYRGPARTKILDNDTTRLLPVLATAYDLQDNNYIKLLYSIKNRLAKIRYGTDGSFYRRIWPIFTKHIKLAISELKGSFPKEAKMFVNIEKNIPITLIDYAYYVNLSFHWLTIFKGASLSTHPNEFEVYNFKLKRGNNPYNFLPYTIESYFKIPFFPEDISIEQVLKLRKLKGLQAWREYIKNISKHFYSDGFNIDELKSQNTEFIMKDLLKKIGEEIISKTSKRKKIFSAASQTVLTIGGLICPPLSYLGFIGPAKEIYDAFNADPVLMFFFKTSKILNK